MRELSSSRTTATVTSAAAGNAASVLAKGAGSARASARFKPTLIATAGIPARIAVIAAPTVPDTRVAGPMFTDAFSARLAAEAAGEAPPKTDADDNAVSVTEVAGAVVRGVAGRLFGKGEKE